jgi:hypothetical protein
MVNRYYFFAQLTTGNKKVTALWKKLAVKHPQLGHHAPVGEERRSAEGILACIVQNVCVKETIGEVLEKPYEKRIIFLNPGMIGPKQLY